MKYLKRFNEATSPDEYITDTIISKIREIDAPEWARVKIRPEVSGSKELAKITGVSDFSINIVTINRSKGAQYFNYSEINDYLDSINELLDGRYDITKCVVFNPQSIRTVSYDELTNMTHNMTFNKLTITYSSCYKDYKANKFIDTDEHDYVHDGDWKEVFIDMLDLRFNVTCKYSRGAYQFTMSKTYRWTEEPSELSDDIKSYVIDIISKLEGIYDLNFESISINSSNMKRMSLEQWEEIDIQSELQKNSPVIRLLFTSK